MRRFAPVLLAFAAGCAGADLMRAESEGAPAPIGGTGDNPSTTGLTTGITAGANESGEGEPTGTIPAETTTSTTDDESDASTSGGSTWDGSADSTGGDDWNDETSTGPAAETTESGGQADNIDLSDWTVVQTNSAREFTLPPGTVVPAGGVLVIGRDASQAAFEGYWGPLGEDVVYINAEDMFPAINGGEVFTLRDANDAVADGPTPPMLSGQSMQRTDVGAAGSWTTTDETDADPGVGHDGSDGAGVYLTEASDATGTGNFVFEYVELQAWP